MKTADCFKIEENLREKKHNNEQERARYVGGRGRGEEEPKARELLFITSPGASCPANARCRSNTREGWGEGNQGKPPGEDEP